MTEKEIFGNKNTPSMRLGADDDMGILQIYGFCGFSVCCSLNGVNSRLASTTPICMLTGA